MEIRYEGPHDEVEFLETLASGAQVVRVAKRGEAIDVAEGTAQNLLEQGSYIEGDGPRKWAERIWVAAPAPSAPKAAPKKGGDE